jgi:hypothetical protein
MRLDNRLEKCAFGKGKPAYEYQDIVADIFKELFYPVFIDEPMLQIVSTHPERRRDLIIPIRPEETSFWSYLSAKYQSDLFLVECKNYSDIVTHTGIIQVFDYMRKPALANIAFLACRKGVNKNADETIQSYYNEDGKLIIVLDDNDFLELLSNHDEATDILRKKYRMLKIKL